MKTNNYNNQWGPCQENGKGSWTFCHFVRLASLRFKLFSASPRKKIFNTLVWVSAPISASVRPRGEIHENVPLANSERSSIIWFFFTNLFLLFILMTLKTVDLKWFENGRLGRLKKKIWEIFVSQIFHFNTSALSSQSFLFHLIMKQFSMMTKW